MRPAALAVAAAAVASSAPAQEAAQEAAPGAIPEPRHLLCEAKGGGRFWIMLWTPSDDGPALHCVEAEALEGLDSCAPDGGWGLSRDGALVGFATEAADLSHEGGWFFARVGPSEFVASASVGTRPPLTLEVAGETFWRMRLSLATGEGASYTAEGEVPIACRDVP